MSKNTSVIQEIELSTGTQIYVQINNHRASLSLDGSEMQTSIWLTVEELDDLRKMITNS